MIFIPKASGQGLITSYNYTVKNGYRFSRPLPGCHLPNSSWPGIIKLFPARESLVSDIPAGDGKNCYIFFSVRLTYLYIGVHVYTRKRNLCILYITHLAKTCTCYMTVTTNEQIQKRPCKDTSPFLF